MAKRLERSPEKHGQQIWNGSREMLMQFTVGITVLITHCTSTQLFIINYLDHLTSRKQHTAFISSKNSQHRTMLERVLFSTFIGASVLLDTTRKVNLPAVLL